LLSVAGAALICIFAFEGGLALPDYRDVIINGGFDSNAANWSHPENWDSLDSRGSATSGSIRSINNRVAAGVLFEIEQCVPVEAGGRYRLSADAYVAPGQQRSPYPGIGVFWFTQPGCPGLGQPNGPPTLYPSFPTNVWAPVLSYFDVPAGKSYARMELGAGRGPGENVSPFAVVHYDNVRFSRVDGLVARAVLPLLISE